MMMRVQLLAQSWGGNWEAGKSSRAMQMDARRSRPLTSTSTDLDILVRQ